MQNKKKTTHAYINNHESSICLTNRETEPTQKQRQSKQSAFKLYTNTRTSILLDDYLLQHMQILVRLRLRAAQHGEAELHSDDLRVPRPHIARHSAQSPC